MMFPELSRYLFGTQSRLNDALAGPCGHASPEQKTAHFAAVAVPIPLDVGFDRIVSNPES
jgi:hypothetical protein